jgi:hypothetical protein
MSRPSIAACGKDIKPSAAATMVPLMTATVICPRR